MMNVDRMRAIFHRKHVFVSTPDIGEGAAAELVAALQDLGATVHGLGGFQERRPDWYEDGCALELSECAGFVAVVERDYDCSTWMAHEALTASSLFREHGIPVPFIVRIASGPLPLGLKHFSDVSTELPADAATAAASVMARLKEFGT